MPSLQHLHWKKSCQRMALSCFMFFLGEELLKPVVEENEPIIKTLWQHTDAVLCCSMKALPVFTFANQAGLDMLETTLVSLQDITLEKIFDENGRKNVCSELPQIMQQGFACLQGGICLSSMGRPVSYERAVAWKVLNDEESPHCVTFSRSSLNHKTVILNDVVRMVTQLRDEAIKLKASSEELQEKINELKVTPPAFMPAPPPGMPSPFSPSGHFVGSKYMPFMGYPGVPMWQFTPPAAVDTSQDHVLRPPVA